MKLTPAKLILAAASLMLAGALSAQPPASASGPISFPLVPDTSPKCTLKQRIGLTDIEIVYSRPNMKRHQVFGGIVPYGDYWRTGDNASTKISFSTAVKLNGVEIPAGKYALYTVPGEKEWNILIYKDIGLFGVDGLEPARILDQIRVASQKVTDPAKSFTIDFDDLRDDSGILNLKWATTVVPLKLEVDVVPDLMVRIAASLNSPGKKLAVNYLRGATFYFDHSSAPKELDQAMIWVNLGLLDKPPIAYQLLYLKAQLLSRQGDRAGAVETARQSQEMAKDAGDHQYFALAGEVVRGARQ